MTTPVLSDPLSADLRNPAKYVIERGIPVFRPHKRQEIVDGKLTGKVKYEVTEADLEEIARNSNEAVEKSFHYPRQTIGHVVPGLADEKSQPAKLIGYAWNYRLARYASGDAVLVADLAVQRDQVDEAKKFPYRSAEYNWKTKKIRGVARLLQDPALELGTYQDAGDTVAYAEAVMDKPNEKPGAGDKAESGDSKPAKPSGLDLKTVFGDLNPDEVVAAERLVKWLEAKYPELGKLTKVKAGEVPDQRPAPAADEDPDDEPEETSDPAADQPDKSGQQAKGQPNKDDESRSMSQNADHTQTVERLQAELDDLRVEQMISSLSAFEFDRDDVKDTLKRVPAADRAAKLEKMKKSMRPKPNSTPSIEVLQDAPIQLAGNDTDPISVAASKMTLEQYQEAFVLLPAERQAGEPDAVAWQRAVLKAKSRK